MTAAAAAPSAPVAEAADWARVAADLDAQGWATIAGLLSAEDCAATAVFLCSSMGAYITGTTINVDGGTNAARGWIGTPSEGWSLTH